MKSFATTLGIDTEKVTIEDRMQLGRGSIEKEGLEPSKTLWGNLPLNRKKVERDPQYRRNKPVGEDAPLAYGNHASCHRKDGIYHSRFSR